MKKKIFIGLGIAYVFFAVILGATNTHTKKEIENPNLLTVAKLGDDYPYTIDNVELKCSPVDAVWVETRSGEKYALNGLAMNLLKDDPSYKGDTNQILKSNKTDFDFLNKGFEICKQGK